MSQFSKKLVSTVVTLSTVLSSVGVGAFAMPSLASAATLMNGDLIKASGPAVYYYNNGKRYVFPNETTYKSWFADFSMVRTISDSELSAVMIGGNITIRPGTKLVKITTDPKVYAVTMGGVLHWVESESVATALYGSAWASRVVDVPDAFFVNYSVGSSVATAVHPDGSLVSYSGSSDRYVVWNGQRRLVTDAGFSANMFQSGNVLMTAITYPTGAEVSSRESVLSDAVVTGGGSTTPVTGSLMVTLASDTPASMVLPKNANNVMFTKVNLMAQSGDVVVTGLKFRRVGVGSASDFSNVYLYKADGTRLTSGRTISTSQNTVEFNGLNLAIASGATQGMFISSDLIGGDSMTTGGQHAFELTDAASVVMTGSGTISGSFPVRGNAMTVGTASVARVDVKSGSTPANPRVGTADSELANFRLETTGSNDVEVRRVTLYQAGTISNSDLSSLKLFQGATEVASTPSVMSDGKIVLNFATPYLIPNGQSRTFNLRGTVTGRSGRTIRIYAEYASDVYAVDRVYNAGAQVCTDSVTSPCNGTYNGSGATTTNASYSETEGGQFTISYNGPATANVGQGQNDAVFYRFAITSGSNDVEIRRFNFAVTSTGSGISSGSTEYLRDIKIKDADTGEIVAGPVACSGTCTAGYKAFTTTVSVTLRAGQTRNFVITADTSNSISTGSTYRFALGGASSSDAIFGSTDLRVLSSGEFLTTGIAPNTTVTGNIMTVLTPSFNVTLAGTPSAGVFVKNQQNIPVAAFTFNAGSQSDIRVTSLKVTGQGDADAGNSNFDPSEFDDVVNSCGVYDAGVQVGNRLSPSTLGTMTFSGLSLLLPRGTSKTLEVRCNADSTVSKTTDRAAIGIDLDADIAAQDQDGNTVTATRATSVDTNATTSPVIAQSIRANGTLTVAVSNQRPSTILVADGSTWQVMARYRADAQYEDMNIDYVGVTSTGPSANFTSEVAGAPVQGGVAIVQSADSECRTYSVRGSTSLPSGMHQAAEVDLSTNPIVVPKGSATYICLMGRLAQTTPSSTNSDTTTAPRSGNVVALGLAAGALTVGGTASTIFTSSLYTGNVNVRATGGASGERVYQAGSSSVGNSFIVRRAKLVVNNNQFAGLTTTLSAGTKTLYRAQFGSEGGAVSMKQLTFKVTVATTSAMTLTNFRLQKNGVEMNTADVYLSDAYGTSLTTSTLTMSAGSATASSTFAAIARFVDEETVSGPGTTYALTATIGSLSSATGDSIVTSLVQKSFTGSFTSNVITGYLVTGSSLLSADSVNGGYVGIETDATPLAATPVSSAFAILWSDVSEQPHYANIYDDSSTTFSRDWTSEYLVDGVSGSMVLNK